MELHKEMKDISARIGPLLNTMKTKIMVIDNCRTDHTLILLPLLGMEKT